MRLQDCDRAINRIALRGSPLVQRAEARWQAARDTGAIPEGLFRFYVNADYFSPNKCPRYFSDPDKVLFSYLGDIAEATRQCLVEARENQEEIKDTEITLAAKFNKSTNRQRDPEADDRQRRAVRYLFLNLFSSLDLVSEIIALFFPSRVSGLNVGRAQFSKLRQWLEQPVDTNPPQLVSPLDFYLNEVHRKLRKLLIFAEPEHDWVSLLVLYRNKLAHFGRFSSMDFRLHDREFNFYAFLPRKWPSIWQRYLEWDTNATPEDQSTFELIEKTCIHIDLIELVDGLVRRILGVLEATYSELTACYEVVKVLEPNDGAMRHLTSSAEACDFRSFARGTDQAADPSKGKGLT